MKNPVLAAHLEQQLTNFRINGKSLPGLKGKADVDALVAQMVDSVARINFVKRIGQRPISPRRLDPKDAAMFEPLRAAIHHMRNGNEDEAFWLVFLFVHCGQHHKLKYRLLRMVYGAFNDKFTWTWKKYSSKPADFSHWLHQHLDDIEKARKNFKFGNHRKYESLGQLSDVFESYANWVGPTKSHRSLIDDAKAKVGADPKALFDFLYKSMMPAVFRFGRTGCFDYLTMLGKIGLADIEPPSAYMVDATGPARGARLLFGGSPDKGIPGKKLDELSIALNESLGVGMQVIEDSLCNWQKSPDKYVAFRG